MAQACFFHYKMKPLNLRRKRSLLYYKLPLIIKTTI